MDWTNPLATGLISFMLPAFRRDLVTGQSLSAVGSGPGSIVGAPQGQAASGWTNANYLKIGDGALLGPLPQFTILGAQRASTLTETGNGRMLYAERNAVSGQQIVVFGIGSTGTQVALRDDFTLGANGAYNVGTCPNGAQKVIGLTRNSATSFDTWVDGVQGAAITATGLTTTFTSTDVVRALGQDPYDPTKTVDDGNMTWVALWNRALSAREIADMSANPYRLLRG